MSLSTADRQIKHRLAVLRHAEEVSGNVAATCRYYGISRTIFYEWRRRHDEFGAVVASCTTRSSRTVSKPLSRR